MRILRYFARKRNMLSRTQGRVKTQVGVREKRDEAYWQNIDRRNLPGG